MAQGLLHLSTTMCLLVETITTILKQLKVNRVQEEANAYCIEWLKIGMVGLQIKDQGIEVTAPCNIKGNTQEVPQMGMEAKA